METQKEESDNAAPDLLILFNGEKELWVQLTISSMLTQHYHTSLKVGVGVLHFYLY